MACEPFLWQKNDLEHRTFFSNKLFLKTMKCPVCFEECAKLSATCSNGHTACDKHWIQLYKAIYEDGKHAFGQTCAKRCFICRVHIPDSTFSDAYFKNLKTVQIISMTKEFCKQTGTPWKQLPKSILDHMYSTYPSGV